MGIEKPIIPRRERIHVSAERRDQARAGMGGEQIKTASEVTPELAVPVAPDTTVAAAAAPAPLPEPPSAPELAAAPELTPTAAPAPMVAPEPTTQPLPAPAPLAVKSPAVVAKPAAATGAKRGRGRPAAAPDAETMEPERSVKIPESIWEDIRLSLVLLPKAADTPANIKAYLVAAHRAYDAQLRKQGKLPAVK